MTILAYVLVIVPISTLVVTLGVGLGLFLIAMPLAWVPNPHGSGIRGFLCGLAGMLLGFGYGYLIFRLLVGPDSFTIVPALVAAIPLLLPPINDLQHARKVAAAAGDMADFVVDPKEVKVTTWAKWGAAIGEAVGIPAGIVLFGVVL